MGNVAIDLLLGAAELVLGAIIAILTTVAIEFLRKPKLAIDMSSPVDVDYPNCPAQKARFLHIKLTNKSMPKWARWMLREPAMQCYGKITFHHLDGQIIFDREMRGRWHNKPEPTSKLKEVYTPEGDRIYIADPSFFEAGIYADIYPGESENFVVAAKFDDDSECYGWSNDNYASDPIWRNPNWKLSAGRYLVKVEFVTLGEKKIKIFRLINDVSRTDFRLENRRKQDVIIS